MFPTKSKMKENVPILVFSVALLMLAGCARNETRHQPDIEDYLRDYRSLHERYEQPVEPEEARPLTIDSSVRIALNENPSLQAAREGVAVARADVAVARAPYYPTLGFNAAYSRWETQLFLPGGMGDSTEEFTIGPTDDWSAGLRAEYLIFDSGERAARLRAALSREKAAGEEAERMRQEIAFAVHQSFYALLSSIEAKGVAQDNLASAEEAHRLARERHEAGAVPRADVIRAQVEVADARLELVRAESAARLARGKLNLAMGIPVETTFEIEAPQDEISEPAEVDIDEALDMAVRARPEMRISLNRIAGARHGIDAARSAYGPRLGANARYGYREADFPPGNRDWSVGVGLEWLLFDGFARARLVERAEAELSREEADIRRLILSVREEVRSANLELREAWESVQAADALVADADESLRLTRERYEAGAGTTSDLLDARTSLSRANFIAVEAKWRYYTALARFERATGSIAASIENENNHGSATR